MGSGLSTSAIHESEAIRVQYGTGTSPIRWRNFAAAAQHRATAGASAGKRPANCAPVADPRLMVHRGAPPGSTIPVALQVARAPCPRLARCVMTGDGQGTVRICDVDAVRVSDRRCCTCDTWSLRSQNEIADELLWWSAAGRASRSEFAETERSVYGKCWPIAEWPPWIHWLAKAAIHQLNHSIDLRSTLRFQAIGVITKSELGVTSPDEPTALPTTQYPYFVNCVSGTVPVPLSAARWKVPVPSVALSNNSVALVWPLCSCRSPVAVV